MQGDHLNSGTEDRKIRKKNHGLMYRQDKKDKSRAPISAKLVANMLSVIKRTSKNQPTN